MCSSWRRIQEPSCLGLLTTVGLSIIKDQVCLTLGLLNQLSVCSLLSPLWALRKPQSHHFSGLWTQHHCILILVSPVCTALQCTKCFHIQWFTGLCGRQLSTQARSPNRSQPATTTHPKPRADCTGRSVQPGHWGELSELLPSGWYLGVSPAKEWTESGKTLTRECSCYSHLRSQIPKQCWGRIV